MSLHPTDGVRILLELERALDPGGAVYRAAIYSPSLQADFSVRFDGAGQPTITASVTPAETTPDTTAALEPRAGDLLRAIARTVGKYAVAATPPRWPPRVLRWRRL